MLGLACEMILMLHEKGIEINLSCYSVKVEDPNAVGFHSGASFTNRRFLSSEPSS